ncbi:DUF1353 domain-containing protein [Mesobacterium pallidum]|uniref:DUF1353 domain-containing protein n=1 Tax=Mesobacterium pallidum TaxID=2872037 RepID=UPI001EE253C9|nr:DUF1353 domain-containing protein [Mesobacterium pallidum]
MRRITLALTLMRASYGGMYRDAQDAGRFTGSVFVHWLGPGSDTSGGGSFLFVPDPENPLTFTRNHADGTVGTLRPEMIYTDGGSIPRLFQPLKGLGPWGYAPAYVVHDWLFVASRCNRDGAASPEEARLAAMPFTESAEVMAEMIKALIAQRMGGPDDVAPAQVTWAVSSPISRALWEQDDACEAGRVQERH